MGHVILSGVSKGMTVPVVYTPLVNLAEGSIVKLNENGSPAEFYVAKHDYESGLNGTGRTLLVRKDCYDARVWHNPLANTLASSSLRSWLNGTYLNMLDEDIRDAIGTTKYYYTPGGGDYTVTTRSDAVFMMSTTELNIYPSSSSGIEKNTEGSILPIASTLKIAYRNGSAVVQWTRTPQTNNTYVLVSYTDGKCYNYQSTKSWGSRPIFTLPSTAKVADDGMVVV